LIGGNFTIGQPLYVIYATLEFIGGGENKNKGE